jgi:protein arginine N-methyltransferase 1
LSVALERLQIICAGTQDWIDLTSTIVKLYRAGVLRDDDLKPEVGSAPASFDSAQLHILMLNDRERTSRFLDAIRATVKPGDIVVDMGTEGLLAVAAAQSGAGHVYALEASSMSDVARNTFRANGLEDRITLIQGWSTQAVLPERADVLVSEILGDEGLGENVLEFTLDARKRLLKPNAKCIPRRVRILGIPVTIPEAQLRRHLFTPEATHDWRSWYGIDLDHLPAIPHKQPATISVKPNKVADWKFLGEPILLTEIELDSFTEIEIATQVGGVIRDPGLFNGFISYFEAELSPDNWLTNHPPANSSWRTNVQLLSSALDVKNGDSYVATFEYRNRGIVNGSGSLDIKLDRSVMLDPGVT